jgi:predicted ATPase/DNA-binding SARP family transcriptional activator
MVQPGGQGRRGRARPAVDDPPESTAIEFRILGPVEALVNGTPIPLGGPRQRALLALLLLEPGRIVAVDRLVDELWHGEPPEGASTTLRSYVARLRAVLAGNAEIKGGAGGYTLEVPPQQIDAVRFERLTREGEEALARGAVRRAAERLSEADSLWRGRPFGELATDGTLRVAAEGLDELRLRSLEQRIEADLALGRSAELVEELEALIRDHPYRERLWRQLMLALYRAERQADALAAYGRARTILDEQLGLEPSEELRRLERAILRQEVPAVVPPEERHNLPAQVTSFVGREAELEEIQRLLAEARLVTLTGVGGTGKTRLALEAAARELTDFPDGVFFVDFALLTDEALVARHVAAALEVREQPDAPATELIVARLRGAELLLVLDNCEHLRDACAELAHLLLSACPRLRVLATSRERLGAPGEVDYPIPPLSVPPPDADPDELRSSEAVRLFLQRARAARPRLADDATAIASAARICRGLDGLPLAIELAAARAKALSLDEIGARLADRFRFLVSWRRLTAARHRTLREAMDWSYELLSNEEQSLLARLSVFAGSFSLDAVAPVCLDGDEERALELVGRLVDASLVVPEEREGRMRYRLLETVRQYAAERLDDPARADTARRHADHYLELAERRSREVEDRGLLTPLASLAVDDGNLLAALHHMEDAGETARELRLCGALWRYWWLRGDIAYGRRRLEGAIRRSSRQGTAARARALRGASNLAHRQGDLETAVALGEESASISLELGDTLAVARAQMAVGNAVSSLGDSSRAETLYRESASAFREAGASWDLATALLNMGDLALGRGDLDETERVATESLTLFRATGDDSGAAANLGNIGFALLERGEPQRASGPLAEALELADRLGFGEWIATMLEGLAAVAAADADDRRAARLLGASARLREDIGASLDVFEERLHARTLASVHERLPVETFREAFAAGRELSMTAAVAYARSSGARPKASWRGVSS